MRQRVKKCSKMVIYAAWISCNENNGSLCKISGSHSGAVDVSSYGMQRVVVVSGCRRFDGATFVRNVGTTHMTQRSILGNLSREFLQLNSEVAA
jgi:hypothetical protein